MNLTSSPAKVNLYLLVGGKVPDSGLHELDSVMAPLELADEISLEVLESGFAKDNTLGGREEIVRALNYSVSIERQDLKIRFELIIADELRRVLLVTEKLEDTFSELLNENNLILKALVSFFAQALELFPEFSLPSSLSIRLTKRIPMQAGLGGGSSNAANLLKLLIKTFGVNPGDRIISLARTLGDDVLPCFIGGSCHYSDRQTVPLRECLRAKKLIPLERIEEARVRLPVVVLKPDFGIETRKAFHALNRDIVNSISPKALKERAAKALISISGIVEPTIETSPPTKLAAELINDFQDVAEKLNPELYTARQLLLSLPGSFHCLMTGSGSALIGYFTTEQQRNEGAAAIRAHFDNSWFCQESYVLI